MSKILVAYFSASGVTKKVAEKLTEAVGADIFEIKPEVPYTDEDLNWQNNKSRSSVEMNDRSSRPKIASKVNNINQYDVVFVGFPIWWYREPSIIDTFMESYDFNGKTIVPFATSGMSSIGESGKIMQALVPNAKVVAGKRFPDSVKIDELKKWASEWA
ncbi:flavodoxin [Fusobacterium simiae]|uniref:Flavodoxin n=1 Tax=Fusobacterium simiae TaxID=855 RepID=A0ABT4DLA7_FUSSI|nr:flavodoxin [Fusobacterium simiae]MCY7008074.1 flavodoxin [Fusobacterium simiae]